MKRAKTKFDLERYNQILLAVFGTGAAVFLAVVAIVAVVSYIASQFGGQGGVPIDIVDNDAAKSQKEATMRIDMCPPVILEGTPYQLIAVSVDRIVIERRVMKLAQSAYESYADKQPNYGCYQSDGHLSVNGNVLVRDTRNAEMRPLLSQNAVVQHMEYPTPRQKDAREAFPPRDILYWEITTNDTNGDGVLDKHDDTGAWLSNIDGTRLTRITPPNSRVEAKTYDPGRQKIYLKVLQDTDNNKTLDEKDGSALIVVDIAQKRIVKTIMETKTWLEAGKGLKPLNAP
ncbi:MAG: hypothetical protein OEW08_14425 [Gammaproteobacteria bacterium]|nr:hypothetical protein [Gammaproteobacteria bacterium]